MATKTFEELKQLAIQIRDEKTNKANTATRIGTQMIEHLNKLEQEYYNIQTVDGLVSEYNVSVNHPTSGIDGSNKYTLSSAIALVPEKYRSVGLKCSFINEAGKPESWKYQGGSWVAASFTKEADGGNKILEWVTDVATTRKQVALSERKSLLQISYKNNDGDIVNEQYIGTNITDTEWGKDSNWEQIPKQKQFTELSNNLLYLENANSLNPKFIDDWGWQKGNRDYTTGEFKEGQYYVSDIIDVEGEDFEFSTNEKAKFVCCYSVNGGISFKNTGWLNNFQIQGFTNIFIILADANNLYIGPSDINVYQSSQEKFYKNALYKDIQDYNLRINNLEADVYGGDKNVAIPLPLNPCLFATNGKDITSDSYPDAYATDYIDLEDYNGFILNGACILSFPYAVYYDSNKEILSTLSPGGTSVVSKFNELVLERSDYPEKAKYIRFHSYSKVNGEEIEYSCIGSKITKGFENRIEKLENNFGNITSYSVYKEIH